MKVKRQQKKRKPGFYLKIRIKPEVLAVIKTKAATAGLTVSDFIRQASLNGKITAIQKVPIESGTLKLAYELNRIGNNLNQITRKINMGELEGKAVLELIEDIKDQLWKIMAETP